MRMPKYEKNMINPLYLRELREDETKSATLTPNDCIPPGEPLVSISLYDSINGEKVYEYLCYGEETLLEVVCKFYCLIARLEGKESIHWANSYCLIEDNFYYHGNTAHKKIDEIIVSIRGEEELAVISKRLGVTASQGGEKIGYRAGTTAVVLLITKNRYFVANIGDSRAVLSRANTAVPLSFDHKPDLPA